MRDRCEILVVGAGPAGLSAASLAGMAGKDVLILDDNPRTGGQIWRHPSTGAPRWVGDFESLPVRFSTNTRALGPVRPGVLLTEASGRPVTVEYDALILATGASERFLPFPGWTLPNVFGLGGLQALAKGGLTVAESRIVLAGTGPLLLAVGEHLASHGALVQGIVEQTSRRSLMAFAPSLLGDFKKLRQAARLRWQLRRAPYETGSYVVRAEGDDRLERVLVRTPGGDRWIDCDFLGVGFDLVPNTELAVALGCQLVGGFVVTGKGQQTSVRNIYAAGELTGIGGVDKATREGALAGAAAAGEKVAANLIASIRAESFGGALKRAFALRPEVLNLAEPDTIVCRCEDVRLRDLEPFGSWREAKLQTRCGMGPCQGRVCGPILEAIKGWKRDSVRPPVVACRVGSLIQGEETKE